MGFLRTVVDGMVDATPVSVAGAGVGTILSDKDDLVDKLKTGLATGVGVSAGAVLPAVTSAIEDKIMRPRVERAESLIRRLKYKGEAYTDDLWDKFGKDRSQYGMDERFFEQAQLVPKRRKAVAKAQRILDKLTARHNKFMKVRALAGLASLAAGGYAGYKYMED